MAYHIYTTKALVLKSYPWGEADRIYSILTRDLGLLRASAGGVRKITSKLRASLEPYSLSTVSFVRGKDYWRITSAEFKSKIEPKEGVLRPLLLLERLLAGESIQPEIFDTIEQELTGSGPYDEAFELRLVAKLLCHLGYLKESDLSLGKKELTKAVNEGIEVSGLT